MQNKEIKEITKNIYDKLYNTGQYQYFKGVLYTFKYNKIMQHVIVYWSVKNNKYNQTIYTSTDLYNFLLELNTTNKINSCNKIRIY